MQIGNQKYPFGDIFDDLTKKIIIIDYEHHEIHEGNNYFHVDYISIPATTKQYVILKTGDKKLHFVFSISSDLAGFHFKTYEKVTSNEDGTLKANILNNNRNSTNITTATLRYNPTGVSLVGATLLRDNILGSGGNPSSRIGGSANRSNEIIMKPNTKYALEIENLSSNTNIFNIGMSWYEI